jgi:hypothetical protein
MKRSTHWLVADAGIREEGSPDHCFYCGEAMGKEHGAECAIRKRTVVMRFRVDLVMEVPETLPRAALNVCFNEHWCGSRLAIDLVDTVERLVGKSGCLCGSVKAKFLREATEEDEEAQLLYVNQLPS